jgi:hypothetical protein
MAERVVTFSGIKDKVPLHLQQRIVDQILMHLGIEIVNLKGEVYVIRDRGPSAMTSKQIELAAYNDPDNQPLTKDELKRMKPKGKKK